MNSEVKKGRPTEIKHGVRLCVLIAKERYDELKDASKEMECSTSKVVRAILDDWMDE